MYVKDNFYLIFSSKNVVYQKIIFLDFTNKFPIISVSTNKSAPNLNFQTKSLQLLLQVYLLNVITIAFLMRHHEIKPMALVATVIIISMGVFGIL